MSDDAAILNEIYQELYAMRSRLEYMNEIQQEVYAMRHEAETMEGILRQIHAELAAIRKGFGVSGGSAEATSSVRKRSTDSKSRFTFFKR